VKAANATRPPALLLAMMWRKEERVGHRTGLNQSLQNNLVERPKRCRNGDVSGTALD
jgi:hypothetical protein